LVNLVVDWHGLIARKQAVGLLVLQLFVPRMASDFINSVSRVWVRVEDLRNKVSTVLRQELWQLILTG
jgi:hypothetical protein